MRVSSLFISLSALIVGAALSVLGARAAVEVVQDRSASAVRETLLERNLDWVAVQSDGLQVILEGTAPTEAHRLRAVSAAATQVDAARVINAMEVQASAPFQAPEFSIEVLRNEAGVTLIGLIPADVDRDEILTLAANAAGSLPVTDLLQIADYPVPAGWNDAITYGMRALSELERSKISISARRVSITAISDSEEQKDEFVAFLGRRVPTGLRTEIEISTPRPVISPFFLRFVLDESGARFDECSADGPDTTAAILAAASEAGWDGDDPCTIGLGQPSATWPEAVALGLGSIAELGGGTITFSNTDITLVALEGTGPNRFDEVVGRLENALPDIYALTPILPEDPDQPGAGPAEFVATLSPEGDVQLRGKVATTIMNEAVSNYASARLNGVSITLGTRIDPNVPDDWSVRVLAGIEALAELRNGVVIVTPDRVTVRGNTGRLRARADLLRLLSEKLGETANYEVDVTYVRALDPIASQPTGEECIEQINAILERGKITFEPSSATIEASVAPVIDDIANIMRRCTDERIEIAGHTDSQGREIMNLELSQERAQAVLNALRERRIPTTSFRAVGYGETTPIADNGSEEGREANRRIEFSLIVPEPEEPTGLEAMEEELPETEGDEGSASE